MVNHDSLSAFAFRVREDGFCEIRADGEVQAQTVASIRQCLTNYAQQHRLPRGLLLDLRSNSSLSIIRLSQLIDSLSRTPVPLAVVLGQHVQQELAALLHHTLAHNERVAYFTNLVEAWAFLASFMACRTTPTVHHQ